MTTRNDELMKRYERAAKFTVMAGLALFSCRQTEGAPPAPGTASTKTSTVAAAPSSSAGARSSAGAADSMTKPRRDPLDVGAPFITLAVDGFRDAVVSVPNGATEPRPLVIALHGNFDRPEWQCGVWREVSGARPFILCPRGSPRTDVPPSEDRWTYGSLQQTLSEIEAAVTALDERFAVHLDRRDTVLVAFSLGAIYASRFAVDTADRYPRLLLIEGGYNGWTRSQVGRFAKAGGERVLIACAQTGCRNAARAAAPAFAAGGVGYRFTYAAGAGHTYDGEVARRIAEYWDWLTGPSDAGG